MIHWCIGVVINFMHNVKTVEESLVPLGVTTGDYGLTQMEDCSLDYRSNCLINGLITNLSMFH